MLFIQLVVVILMISGAIAAQTLYQQKGESSEAFYNRVKNEERHQARLAEIQAETDQSQKETMELLYKMNSDVNEITWNRFCGTAIGIFAGGGTGLAIDQLIDEAIIQTPLAAQIGCGIGGAVAGGILGYVVDRMTKRRGDPCGCCAKSLGTLMSFVPWVAYIILRIECGLFPWSDSCNIFINTTDATT